MKDRPLVDLGQVWSEFRDWFGVVWSLRVMERMNASSQMYRWPVTLEWAGFVWRSSDESPTAQRELSAREREAIELALRTLLRRFVSAEWIEDRLSATHSTGDLDARESPKF